MFLLRGFSIRKTDVCQFTEDGITARRERLEAKFRRVLHPCQARRRTSKKLNPQAPDLGDECVPCVPLVGATNSIVHSFANFARKKPLFSLELLVLPQSDPNLLRLNRGQGAALFRGIVGG